MQANPIMVEALAKVTVEDRLAEAEHVRLARLASRPCSDEPGARSAVVRWAMSAALILIGAARASLGARRGSVTRT
jgi:hypothetical protein